MRSWINRLFYPSMRAGITLGFTLITGLVLVLVVISYFQLSRIRPQSNKILTINDDMTTYQRLLAAGAALNTDLERYLVVLMADYQNKVSQDLQEMTTTLDLLKASPVAGSKPQMAEISPVFSQLQGDVQYLLDVQTSGAKSEDIIRTSLSAYDNITKVQQQASTLSQEALVDLQTAAKTQSQIANRVLNQSVILGILVLSTSLLAGVIFNLRLGGITKLTQIAQAIAGGDLERTAPEGRRDEVGTLAVAFNTMTHRLRDTVSTLEQNVADRTRAIEASSEISRRLSTILDQKQLALTVAEEVQRAFNYYHAHIYLYDEAEENLVMVGGTGEAGQLMLDRRHQIARGRGLVGRAAETNQVVLVPDTQVDPNWLANPLLPDTKSEVAVPIAVGERVLGVLDVQHNIVNGLGKQDVDLLQSIANQVAVAVQNATLFTQTQRVADREALVNAISQKIQTASSVEGVLQVTARELGAALRAQRVLVQVGGDATIDNTGKG
jgi:putative methionine-R-sulfoxide reductase with GAF domain